MKLNQEQDSTIIIGEVSKNEVGFSPSKANKTIMLLTSKLYSEPINSFIREICSNAWDSHVEAGTDDPIVVTINRDLLDDELVVISFRDFGVGLSPERFDSVYRFLGETTKEDSNDFIGAYGLGKFSPLSVVDMVPVTSFYNGTKYSYLMYKNGMGINIDLVDSTPTDEKNGLMVEVKVKKRQYANLVSGISSQLRFFENVYFQDNINNMTYSTLNKLNSSKIKHYKSFSISTIKRENYDGLSILNGKVEYSFNADTIIELVPDQKGLVEMMEKVNITLRFDIGELDLIPSRESLHYTEKTLEAIIKKLEEARDELIEMRVKDLYGGRITDKDLINLKDPSTMSLENFPKIEISAIPIFVEFNGGKFNYSSLYSSVDDLLSIYISPAQLRLVGGKIMKNVGYGNSLRKYFGTNIYNYSPDDYSTIQKKFIRQSLHEGSLFREDWAQVSDVERLEQHAKEQAKVQKIYLTNHKEAFLRGILRQLSIKFISAGKPDVSGITQIFIDSCKPQKRVTTSISCLVISKYEKYRYSFTLEEISMKKHPIVITGTESKIIPHNKDNETKIFRVAKTNIDKLLALENTISEEEYVKLIYDKIVYENELMYCLNKVDYNDKRKLTLLGTYVELPEELKDLIHYRGNLDELSLVVMSHLIPKETKLDRIFNLIVEYKPALEVMEGFNLSTLLGVKWAKNRLKELNYKLLTKV